MGADIARRSHEIFSSAIEVDEPDRAGFIETACAGDRDLRRAVDRLVRAVEDSATFLATPALSGGARVSEPQAHHREIVGGYRIVRMIGVGGMATVYEAVQERPHRRVALKVMRHGFSRSSALARFRFETEVLARLHHPGIAQIYEAGAHDERDGLCTPFFAMELIEQAHPITAHADAVGLSLRDRLGMLAGVCDAIHHGHQLGIIHRDLKPGNVLVGADGRTKVIDFGVARSTDPAQTRITYQADVGQLLGTLNYMSPEQCTGDAAALDIRTDVYSLGVILYELVCGRLPHDVSGVPITEALRIVQREEPRRPSLINPALRGDLEAIILKAIDKDRDRRYPTASEFGADIRRFLDNAPIQARPATTVYQMRKFAQRNRALVGGGAAVLLTLIAGILATTRMAYVANQARTAAEARQRELEQVTAFQDAQLSGINVAEMGDRLRTAMFAATRDSIERSGDDPDRLERDLAEFSAVTRDVNFTSVAMQTLDENVLQRSRQAIDAQFASQPVTRARLLHTLAQTMDTLGLPESAAPVLAQAMELRTGALGPDHPDTLASLHATGALHRELGKYPEAEASLREAFEGRARVLGSDHPDTLNSANSLGVVLRLMGRVEEAASIWASTLEIRRRVRGDDHPDTLDSLNNVGLAYATQGKLEQAEACWRELLERRTRVLGTDHPDTMRTIGNLGTLLWDQGRNEEALPFMESAVQSRRRVLGDDHPATLLSIGNLASLLHALGDLSRAEALAQECLQGRARVLGAEHPQTLTTKVAMASLLVDAQRIDEAESMLREALASQRRTLGDANPDTLESMSMLGVITRDTGNLAEAESFGAESVRLARASLHPGDWRTGAYLERYGRTLTAMKRWSEAEGALLEAHATLSAARGESDPRTRDAIIALASLYEAWNAADPAAGHAADAAEWRTRAGGT